MLAMEIGGILDEPPDSFFKARDLYDTALYYGDLRLTAHACSVFRYLLENVMYRPQEPKDYGFVSRPALGEHMIAKVTSMSPVSVGRALRELEGKGMLKRRHRPKATGGRATSDIQVVWLTEGV
jgi:hypothetical protein